MAPSSREFATISSRVGSGSDQNSLTMEGPLAIAQAFTEQTFHYTSQAELASGLEACQFELGFHRFAILHPFDLRRRPAAMIHINHYTAVCSEPFIPQRLFL